MRPRLPRLPRLSAALPSPSSTPPPPAATNSNTNTARRVRTYSVAAVTPAAAVRPLPSAAGAAEAVVPTTANFPGTSGATRNTALNGRQTVGHQQADSLIDAGVAASLAEAEALFEEDYGAAGPEEEHFLEEPLAGPSRTTTTPSRPTTSRSYTPSPSSSTSPPLPRRLLLPGGDSLCEQSLPYTESELYSFLHTVKATEYRFGPDKLAALHSVPYFARLVSTRTYRFLIQYAFEAANLELVEVLLAEMGGRGIKKDEHTLRVLLRGYLRHGKDERAREVADLMRERGVVLVSTKPRVTVTQGKGKEREREDFDVLWKGFEVRGRDVRLREEAAERVREREGPRTSAVTVTKRGRRRGGTALSPGSIRPPSPFTTPPRTVTVPRDPAALSGSDVSTVVSVLAEEGRGALAFRVAEIWLQANRPSSDSPSSSLPSPPSPSSSKPFFSSSFRLDPSNAPSDSAALAHRTARYHSTALVLLNILLRTLFSERASASSIRSYTLAFLARHSAPSPACPLTPNLATLRTLVSGLKGVPDAWQDAVDMVDWFGYLWGMPITGKPHSERIYFHVSRSEEVRVFRHLGISREDLATGPWGGSPVAYSDAEKRRPHALVPPDVALLLLTHATDSFLSRALLSPRRIAEVRRWWSKDLVRDEKTNELWTSFKMREAWKRAVVSGLMVSRRDWGKEKKVKGVRHPVIRPGEARGRGRTRDMKAKCKGQAEGKKEPPH